MRRLVMMTLLGMFLLGIVSACGSSEVELTVSEEQLRETQEFIDSLPPEEQERMREMQQMQRQMLEQQPGQ